jgi:hypothetical protein
VPLEAVKFNFVWEASKPRYMSDVELPPIKEKAGGVYKLSGRLGEKDVRRKTGSSRWTFARNEALCSLNIDPERRRQIFASVL